ncbi:putative F-box domain-containing protein [Medicago truncatula]|uniref:F-box/RNI/FBD-like domain protein n=1 Tax=Medicago truncatula TaxID=3880 RepID=G7J5B2_MEDTR|nr:F-box/RNI/FBD-like domain protein [Medicago truncatula]RHN71143.1 putative F-box domain-containing protein [Medicago truncatula]
MSKSKKQRSSIPIEECEYDRVSSLPDSIICHILSFLPTKDTVATSILSKRWKPLCISVLTLDFTDHTIFTEITTICSHIYSVLLSCDNTLPILSFRLKCCFRLDEPNNFTQLIIAAIQRRTETLELNMLFHTFDMKLASNIFTCRKFTVLKLKLLILST